MPVQSEAALENGLIYTLQKMNYEYVHIEEEKNPTTYNLARMNMLLHGIKFSNFRIENGDTLEADAFGDTQFDAVVANPPFSAEWSAADKFNNDDRFSKAGRLAPRKTADYAFILHMIYHLNEGGTMALSLIHISEPTRLRRI